MYYTVKSIAILIAVAAAGYSSYHIVEVGLAYQLAAFAFVMPLFIDGLAIIATLARGNDRFPLKAQAAANKVLAGAGIVSIGANLAAGHNIGQRLAGVVAVGAYVVAEWFVSQMGHRVAVAMVAKTVADAELAAAMATAAADMATAVADAVTATEARVRTEMAAQAADLIAEAERATQQAAEAERAARIEADRIAREQATAERLAVVEAERVALAEQLAKSATRTPATSVAKPASVDEVAKARVASGQASAMAMAILATDPTLSDEDVVRVATARGEVTSTRTARRVRKLMAEQQLVAA